MKWMLKALGKTDRCLVGVVLFARLECLRRNAPDPSRQRRGPPPAKQSRTCECECETCECEPCVMSRPPFVKRSGSFDQTSCLWRFFASFFFFFFFFFFLHFLHFLETGKVKTPPPPNGHARILVNAEIYGRSLNTECSATVRYRNFNAPNMCKIKVMKTANR